MPRKKAITAYKNPISIMAFGRSSKNETAIITPAEKPKVGLKIFEEGVCMKNAIAPPIAVEKPAIIEKIRPMNIKLFMTALPKCIFWDLLFFLLQPKLQLLPVKQDK